MNKLLVASLVAALSGIFVAPKTARAGDDEVVAAIGGFIGGVIVGSHLDRDDHVGVHGRVIIDSGHHRNNRDGHWEWNTVRVWVPGRWVVSYEHGRRVRCFERGHYEHRRERVWVPHHHHHRHRR